MKLSTKLIQTIEMTQDEENALWDELTKKPREERDIQICGKRLRRWDTDDGRNQMWLEGENFYRPIYIIKP